MKNDFYKRVFGDPEKDEKREPTANVPKWRTEQEEDVTLSYEQEREARGTFSRIGLSLFTFTAISYAVIGVVYLILALFLPGKMEELTDNIYFTWILNVVSMYVVALPALYFMLRGLKRKSFSKSRLGADEFVLLFFIAEAIMLAGSQIGTVINTFIGAQLGRDITNDISELISDSPIWLVILVAVVIGPIVEELIFRKLIIDRLSVFGDLTAVLISSVAFGLFHGNLYQFFYAAGLGLVLGYIYTKTGNLLYPILMHMILNFIGSVAVLPIADMLVEIQSMAEVITAGGGVDYLRLFFIGSTILSYLIIQYGFAIAGFVILIRKLSAKSLYISNEAERPLPRKKLVSISIVNVGVILFLAASLIQFVINIFAE